MDAWTLPVIVETTYFAVGSALKDRPREPGRESGAHASRGAIGWRKPALLRGMGALYRLWLRFLVARIPPQAGTCLPCENPPDSPVAFLH